MAENQVAGLYIHFPFCAKKCPYCHFYSVPYDRELVTVWRTGIEKEADLLGHLELSFDTLYLGGGTPSLINPRDLVDLKRSLETRLRLNPQEFTLEVNPGLAKAESLLAWREAGVNRISLGVQSFDDRILRLLGRDHSSSLAVALYDSLRKAGFDNIGIDLMIGISTENTRNARRILNRLRVMKPDHVSLYILENLEGLPFEATAKKNPVDEDRVVDDFWMLTEGLQSMGLFHYEISNFAGSGKECRHNLKYWRYEPFLGLGPSACSHLGNRRWCHRADLSRWLEAAPGGDTDKEEIIDLSPQEAIKEALVFGLRLVRGINLPDFESRFGVNLLDLYAGPVAELERRGLLIAEGDTLKIPEEKLLVSNQVLNYFV